MLALVGRNGAGKTTLMRLIADEVKPTSGEIQRTTTELTYVPDETILYEHLTGKEFLRFISIMSGVDKRQIDAIVEKRLIRAHLTDAANQLTKTYSLGMRRQLSLAAALIQDPDVLILDEITNGLDPVANAEVKEQIRELAVQGKAIFLSSHLLDIVVDVADRILVMDHGEMRYLGPLPEYIRAASGSTNRRIEEFYRSLLERREEKG